jgi:hypothetical protein
MAKFSRDKGATFEREIANELTALLGKRVKRNIGQARDGGDDITIPPYRIECKRRASIAVYAWLDQCAEACRDQSVHTMAMPQTEPAHIPIVVGRADHREPIVVMRWSDFKNFLRPDILK